uniref:Reverse transcriptase domain-containing protein n=2 Tax=Tanacetum cinerariifolium TaxID=118510 RepID=A0A6L2NWU1_TANCI|nr:hypothetical protein [Tanacetum cinerariifolium]
MTTRSAGRQTAAPRGGMTGGRTGRGGGRAGEPSGRVVPHLITRENKRIERYIYGHALQIRAMVATTALPTIHSVVLKARMLTDEAIRNGSLKKSTKKRENGREFSRNENARDDNKSYRTGRVFAKITNPVRKEYTGTAPKCTNYSFHHNPKMPCRKCTNCNRLRHFAIDFRAGLGWLNRPPRPGANRQNQPMSIEGGQGRRNNGNQARGRAFMMGAEEAHQGLNIMTDIESSDLGFSYEIEIASGQLVEITKVIRHCKLEIEGHTFDINLISFRHNYTCLGLRKQYRLNLKNDMSPRAGSRDRTPMLTPGRYAQWRSRFMSEIETLANMSDANKAHFKAEKEVIHMLLTGNGDEIYSTVDSCNTAHEMWIALKGYNRVNLLTFKMSRLICSGNLRTMTIAGARETLGSQAEQVDWLEDMDEEVDEQELEAHYSFMAKIQEVLPTDLGTDAEPLEKVQYDDEYNVISNEKQHSEQPDSINNTCAVEKVDRNVIPDSLDILVEVCLMPLAIKTQNDSFKFVHELKQEMFADLEYVKSLKKEIDEFESNKADFSNIYDLLLQECVSKDVMCSYLHSLPDLTAQAELQCLYLHKMKECECLAEKLSKQTKKKDEKGPKEDPAYYPADRGNNDDDESSNDDDDDDDVEKDEEDKEEEEEHLALADPSDVSTDDLVPSS